jgi:hypothetical protein
MDNKALRVLSECSPGLTSLSIANCGQAAEDDSYGARCSLLDVFERCPTLTSLLSVDGYALWTGDDLEDLLITRSTRLTALALSNCATISQHAHGDRSLLECNLQLVELTLSDCLLLSNGEVRRHIVKGDRQAVGILFGYLIVG